MDVMNVKELAEYLHCSIISIRRMIYNKEIPYFTIGNRYFFKRDSIDNYIANCEMKNMQLMKNNQVNSIR